VRSSIYAQRCADYILSSDIELDIVYDKLRQINIDSLTLYNRGRLIDIAKDSVWYSALIIRDGKKWADKAVNEVIMNVMKEKLGGLNEA
jgi:hypothetical protein